MSNYTNENLIPFTGTVKAGQCLLRLSNGSFFPIGTGGASSGSSMYFYKCVSAEAPLTLISPDNPPSASETGYQITCSPENAQSTTTNKCFRAFGGDQYWISNIPSEGALPWIMIQFSESKIINRYNFWTGFGGNSSYAVYAWQLEGSNNGTDFTLLDERTGQNLYSDDGNLVPSTKFSGSFANTTAYTYYRLTITSRGNQYNVSIKNLQLLYAPENITWSGYKATLDNGVYSYASTLTTGLSAAAGCVPEIGGIYSANAMVRVNDLHGIIPTDYIWYLSCNHLNPYDTTTSTMPLNFADTGQLLTLDYPQNLAIVPGLGKMVYTAKNVQTSDNPRISSNFLTSNSQGNFTLPGWHCDIQSGYWCFGIGNTSGNNRFGLFLSSTASTGYSIRMGDSSYLIKSGILPDAYPIWRHFCLILDRSNTSSSLYIDGTLIGTSSTLPTFEATYANQIYVWAAKYAQFSDIRLYDRVLTAPEILALAQEHNPATQLTIPTA